MNDTTLQLLERIATALERKNELLEAQEMRQRKLDIATYESMKASKGKPNPRVKQSGN